MSDIETPPRNAGEDVVRILGLVAVVVGHVWYIEPVIRWTYSWHVPLFFILGGYHWVARRSFPDEVRVRFARIGRPYLFWWVVAGVVYAVWERFWGVGYIPVKFIALAAWGGLGALRPWTAFWFFSAFFIAVLIVRVSMRGGWWWTLAFAYAGLIISHVEPETARLAPLAAIAAMACTGFVLLGIGLRELRRRLRHPVRVGLGALGVGIAGIFVPIYRPLEIKSADFGVPGLSILVAALIGSGLILVGSEWGPKIPPAAARVVGVLARCNVAVFLSHGIVLLVLGTPHNGGWRDFALVLLIPLGFALLTLRSRWAPWIHGVPDFSYRGSSHKRFRGAMS